MPSLRVLFLDEEIRRKFHHVRHKKRPCAVCAYGRLVLELRMHGIAAVMLVRSLREKLKSSSPSSILIVIKRLILEREGIAESKQLLYEN
jgi:hypothetical protein